MWKRIVHRPSAAEGERGAGGWAEGASAEIFLLSCPFFLISPLWALSFLKSLRSETSSDSLHKNAAVGNQT